VYGEAVPKSQFQPADSATSAVHVFEARQRVISAPGAVAVDPKQRHGAVAGAQIFVQRGQRAVPQAEAGHIVQDGHRFAGPHREESATTIP
jgi:hypothetical protein